jgi:Domain of unknown function (DUF222)
VSTAPDYDFTWPGRPPSSLTGLLDAATAAVGQLTDQADLDAMADRDAAAVMGTLTTLVGRLDGLRVQVARAVRDRDICGLRGTRSLAGWLRADARLADDAWKIGRLATAGRELPQVTALLGAGAIGLAQAATACWQIAQLPAASIPPAVINPPGPCSAPEPGVASDPSGPCSAPEPGEALDPPGEGPNPPGPCSAPEPGEAPDPDATGGSGCRPDQPSASGDGTVGQCPSPCAGGGAESPGFEPPDGPIPTPGPAGLPAGVDRSGGEGWAGLWRAGDVHGAADQLFAAFLPGLDSGQLRQLGAHLREAADTQDRAADEHDDYARRGLRISRSLYGTGEITGRLHAEAAEQVIAAFDRLGRKTGPDDTRTKAQRWADALTRLTATTPDPLAGPAAPDTPPGPTAPAGPAHPAADPAHPGDEPAGPGGDGPGDAGPHTGRYQHRPERDPAADGTAHPGPPAAPGDHGDQDDDQPSPADRYTGHDHTSHDHRAQAGHANGMADGRRDNGSRAGASGPIPAAFQRPRIIVTVPLDTLLGRPLASGATLGPGTPLTAEAARRLACDADIIRLITTPHPLPGRDHCGGNGHDRDGNGHDRDGNGHDRDGVANPGDATAELTARLAAAIGGLPPPLAGPSAVLDIGRQSPGWTPRQRDALHAQYGGHCGFGRCDGPIDVIHHIIHWLHGGRTRIINGFPCCLYHHWLLHEGGWRIQKHADGTITTIPPPPGWKPGTIYRNGKPVYEHPGAPGAP